MDAKRFCNYLYLYELSAIASKSTYPLLCTLISTSRVPQGSNPGPLDLLNLYKQSRYGTSYYAQATICWQFRKFSLHTSRGQLYVQPVPFWILLWGIEVIRYKRYGVTVFTKTKN